MMASEMQPKACAKDEEWNQEQCDSTAYLMQGHSQVTLPRPSRHLDQEKPPQEQIKADYRPEPRFSRYMEPKSPKHEEERTRPKSTRHAEEVENVGKFLYNEREKDREGYGTSHSRHSENKSKYLERQRSTEKDEKYFEGEPKVRARPDRPRMDKYQGDHEGFERYYDNEKYYDNRKHSKEDPRYAENGQKSDRKYLEKQPSYAEDDGFEEHIKYRPKSRYDKREEEDRARGGRYFDEEKYYQEESRKIKEVPVPKVRQKYAPDDARFYSDDVRRVETRPREQPPRYIEEVKPRTKYSPDDPRFYDSEKPRHPTLEKQKSDRQSSEKSRSKRSDEYYEKYAEGNKNGRKIAESRQRSPSPEEKITPRDRFKDAKEKFLLMEKDRLEQERKSRAETPVQGPGHRGDGPLHRDGSLHRDGLIHRDGSLLRDSPIHRGDGPLHRGEVPLHREEAVIRREEVVIRRGETPIHRGETPIHRGELPIHRGETPINRETPIHRGETPNHRNDIHRGDIHRGDIHRGDIHRGDINRGDIIRGDINRGDIHRGDIPRGDIQRGDIHRGEIPISPIHKEKPMVKRHESMAYPSPKDKYDRFDSYEGRDTRERIERERVDRFYDDRYEFAEPKPKPAPRSVNHGEEVRYRREVPLERYRNTDKYDPKRRSMFNLIEEEHRKNSNEIAKELKRRSYMENNNYDPDAYKERSYADHPEDDRYPGIDRDAFHFSKSSIELDKIADMKYDPKFLKNQKAKVGAGYRHSYAEPKLRLDNKNGKKFHAEILHRTNSSVSNTGRVGIASVHPY